MNTSSLGRLLIVDDEIELLNSLADKLARQGYETVRFSSPHEALNALAGRAFDLLLTDLMMPGMDGITLLQAARKIEPDLAGIVMTGQATVQTAVDAMKSGAADYILKPFKLNVILPVLARALELRRLRLENLQLRETVGIYELCNAIAFTLDHQTLLNKVIDAAMQQCEAEEASIMLPTDKGDELRVAVIRGDGRAHLVGERVPLEHGIAGWVTRHREPLTLMGEVRDPRFSPVQARSDIRCAISMPMLVGGKLVGVLNVNSTNRRQSSTMGQVKSLGILANTGASALESARLHLAVLRAEEQYRSIFENASEGILQSSPDGRVQIANPAMAGILGYDSPGDLIAGVRDLGSQVYQNGQDREEVKRLVEEHGQVQNIELRMVRKDGGRIWVSLNGRAIRNSQGKTLRYESTIIDITRRKFAEESLRSANEALEQRVRERTAELEAANKELEAFSYSVSHDLRAPLRAIDGYARIVISDFGPSLPDEAQDYLRDVLRGAQQMSRLVDDLLGFSRLSRQPLRKQPVDTLKMVQKCLEELKPVVAERPVEIRIGDLAPCQADPNLLKQVWFNLLSNAFKYTGKRNPAVIEIGCQSDSLGSTYFVKDNGAGFDMRYVHKLFGVFQRLHRAEDYEGTGVGLAIVQRIVQRHLGRVWAEAEPDRGATFFFFLPSLGSNSLESSDIEKNQ
ncbi:response regulator [Zavarzinella formosa]|uniref:response regulator n=1 Tax=Zavarzinella formosa TaxID=360055 RepID=UPI0002F3905D|nr:response regulator [Zavarzinella formosa]